MSDRTQLYVESEAKMETYKDREGNNRKGLNLLMRAYSRSARSVVQRLTVTCRQLRGPISTGQPRTTGGQGRRRIQHHRSRRALEWYWPVVSPLSCCRWRRPVSDVEHILRDTADWMWMEAPLLCTSLMIPAQLFAADSPPSGQDDSLWSLVRLWLICIEMCDSAAGAHRVA